MSVSLQSVIPDLPPLQDMRPETLIVIREMGRMQQEINNLRSALATMIVSYGNLAHVAGKPNSDALVVKAVTEGVQQVSARVSEILG